MSIVNSTFFAQDQALLSFDREPEKNAREVAVILVRVSAFFGGVRV